jgi:eukaryotic-like serine/threonine-protein kinase
MMPRGKDPRDTVPPFAGDHTTVAMPSEIVGKKIGPYRLLQVLGEGGMGTVYLAEQTEPIKRQVALKIIKLGMDTREVVARFESERQALARMNHPHIARVHDAGATDQGRPYFVMEYVRGVPVTEYCDQHRLDNRARLEIFIDICQGVHHAHQKGIIHRDLKPQNVLVEVRDGRPVAKVIDFGVAKATDQSLTDKTLFTQHGRIIGTPSYMSPEQAEMSVLDIDTTTDVYSLGVMLYELLAGFLPLDPEELNAAGWMGIQTKIREHQPRRISAQLGTMGDKALGLATSRSTTVARLARQCSNELEWITLRAMEKDRTRRYQSASEFAADIRRYLANEPVQAHRPSLTYQMRKLVVRHKYRFGLMAGLILILIGFMVTTTIQSGRIARERDRANQEAETAEQVSEFLVGLFEVSDPSEARGNTVTAREILAEGAQRIGVELDDQPLVKARLMATMGAVHKNLGLYDQAGVLLDKALGLALRGEDRPLVVNVLTSRGLLAYDLGNFAACLDYYQRALEFNEATLGSDHPELAVSLKYVGIGLHCTGDLVGAKTHYERALAIQERVLDPDDPQLAPTVISLGSLLGRLGDHEESLLHLRRGVELAIGSYGPDSPFTATAILHLGHGLVMKDDLDRARVQFERALAIQEKVLEPDHLDLANAKYQLGAVLRKQNDLEGARILLEQALAIQEKVLEPVPGRLLWTLKSLADITAQLGDQDRAAELNLRVRDIEAGAPR